MSSVVAANQDWSEMAPAVTACQTHTQSFGICQLVSLTGVVWLKIPADAPSDPSRICIEYLELATSKQCAGAISTCQILFTLPAELET